MNKQERVDYLADPVFMSLTHLSTRVAEVEKRDVAMK